MTRDLFIRSNIVAAFAGPNFWRNSTGSACHALNPLRCAMTSGRNRILRLGAGLFDLAVIRRPASNSFVAISRLSCMCGRFLASSAINRSRSPARRISVRNRREALPAYSDDDHVIIRLNHSDLTSEAVKLVSAWHAAARKRDRDGSVAANCALNHQSDQS